MALAATEHQVSLLYREEAVLQLLPLASPVAVKDFTKAQKLFELYDIEDIYVCQQALDKFRLKPEQLQIPVIAMDQAAQATLLSQFTQILVT